MDKIELLSPAGDFNSFKAAIEAGADAVYFGLNQFNARKRATNINLKELEYLTNLAKSHNVKSYLTLNVLIKDEEFPQILELSKNAISSGIDAIIVQDIGLVSILQKFFPDLEIHASTQMTSHNISQCEFLKSFKNIKQINLSRELSLEELKPICNFLENNNIVSEVFVHGAYCISYSGQCYFSNDLYGEAGNRGACVQPCRRLYSCSQIKSLSPFNLKDNCAFPLAEKLIQAGAKSLKIEGRIKGPKYVWSVTKAWRNQLNLIKNNQEIQTSSFLLENSMNRGFSSDYLESKISSEMFTDNQKDHSLEEIGKILNYNADKKILSVQLYSNFKIDNNTEISIYNREKNFVCTGLLKNQLSCRDNIIDFDFIITNKISEKLKKDFIIWRQKETISNKELESKLENLKPTEKKLSVKVFGKAGEKLKCIFSCDKSITLESKNLLEISQNKILSETDFLQTFGKLGGTNYKLEKLDLSELEKNLFFPLSELKQLRREAISLLEERQKLEEIDFKKELSNISLYSKEKTKSQIYFYCSQIEVAKLLLKKKQNVIFELSLNFETDKINFILENKSIIPSFPEILFDSKLEEAKIILERLSQDKNRSILCKNTGLALEAKKLNLNIIAGENFNITNSYSVDAYNSKFSLKAFIPSIELSPNEILSLQSKDVEIWYPLYSKELLMQSRQCLCKKLSNCKKDLCDSSCIENCQKQIEFCSNQNDELIAIKRKGFFSGIYRRKYVSNTNLVEKLNKKITSWIVDLRFENNPKLNEIISKSESILNLCSKEEIFNSYHKKFYI